jgi:hypothetical protein
MPQGPGTYGSKVGRPKKTKVVRVRRTRKGRKTQTPKKA